VVIRDKRIRFHLQRPAAHGYSRPRVFTNNRACVQHEFAAADTVNGIFTKLKFFSVSVTPLPTVKMFALPVTNLPLPSITTEAGLFAVVSVTAVLGLAAARQRVGILRRLARVRRHPRDKFG
jgi:hypothetical protein